ncbi:hypothetical protein MMRN_58500 [Mycobacterium marinum]|nr:hypothetical protein MMRN_58500 [Mycobacterium marinum]
MGSGGADECFGPGSLFGVEGSVVLLGAFGFGVLGLAVFPMGMPPWGPRPGGRWCRGPGRLAHLGWARAQGRSRDGGAAECGGFDGGAGGECGGAGGFSGVGVAAGVG